MSSSRKEPKGILRKKGEPSRDKNKSATFDEMNIIATLHPADKDYGYMKVDEPPTPYNYEYEEGEKKPFDPNTLAAKLAEGGNEPMKSQTMKTAVDELTPEEKEKRKAFEERRKAHYNEYLIARKSKVNKTPDTVVTISDEPMKGRSRKTPMEYPLVKSSNVNKAPDKLDIDIPVPGTSRSPDLVYCKEFPNCPGHNPGSPEKCGTSRVKGKMDAYTPKKSAGPR